MLTPCDFLEHLNQVHLAGDETMTILDFEPLYPSLNLNAPCLLFYRFLIEHAPEQHQDLALLCDTAHLVCHNSFFEFKGIFYRQLQGVPIGSPMAGTLVEIVEKSAFTSYFRRSLMHCSNDFYHNIELK